MIASSEVASASIWLSPSEEHERRDEQDAAAHAEQAGEDAGDEAEHSARSPDHQVDGHGQQQDREEDAHGAGPRAAAARSRRRPRRPPAGR